MRPTRRRCMLGLGKALNWQSLGEAGHRLIAPAPDTTIDAAEFWGPETAQIWRILPRRSINSAWFRVPVFAKMALTCVRTVSCVEFR